jgi:hypothetical protein
MKSMGRSRSSASRGPRTKFNVKCSRRFFIILFEPSDLHAMAPGQKDPAEWVPVPNPHCPASETACLAVSQVVAHEGVKPMPRSLRANGSSTRLRRHGMYLLNQGGNSLPRKCVALPRMVRPAFVRTI